MNLRRILQVQLVVIAYGLWSMLPDKLHMEITVRGDSFTVRMNDRQIENNIIPGHPGGRVGFNLTDIDSAQKVHFYNPIRPQGWRDLVVTDLATGKIVATDSDLKREILQHKNDQWFVSYNGIFTTRQGATLYVGNTQWKDYTLAVDFMNPYSGEILVRIPDKGRGAVFSIRPFNNDMGWEGVPGAGAVLPIPTLLVTKQVVARLFLVYLIALAIILGMWAITIPVFFLCALIDLCKLGPILSWPLKIAGRPRAASFGRGCGILIITLCAALFLILALWIMVDCHEKIPHIQDSSVYLFQAKMHADGMFFLPPPSFIDSVNFEFMVNRDGKWYGKYPPGHPFVLTLGILADRAYSLYASSGTYVRTPPAIDLPGGRWLRMPLQELAFLQSLRKVAQPDGYIPEMPWIEPPLLGVFSLLLLVVFARKLFSFPVAVLSSIFAVASPFFVFLAASFMSHITCLLALLIFFYLLLRMEEGGRKSFAFWAGCALGWAFLTRPLSAVAVAVPWIAWQATRIFRKGRRWECVKRLIVIGIGVAIPCGFQLWYNYHLTGDPWLPPFVASNMFDKIGFGEHIASGHTFARGMTILENTLFYLFDNLFGWPHYFTLVFIMIPFVVASEDKRDWLLLASGVGISVAYICYFARIREHFGPRYWFEAMPVYIILSARGIVTASESCGALAVRLARAFRRPRYVAFWPQLLPTAALLLFAAWLVKGNVKDYFPRQLREHHCYNDIDARIPEMARKQNVHNAIVFVKVDGPWQNYGSVFALNSPLFDTDIVYAKDLGREKNRNMAKLFPGRDCYLADFQRKELRAMREPVSAPPTAKTTEVTDDETRNEEP
ncbi:MAG: glycosyltransferase family 39 protein [Candidatus Aureabacteria bacterium]|nr:glycosyltransferase family 39 protein [Candidatus Auribacterota bacterium]